MPTKVLLVLYAFVFTPCLLGVLYVTTRAALAYAERKYGIDKNEFLQGE